MPVEILLVGCNGPVFMRCSPVCTECGADREASVNWHIDRRMQDEGAVIVSASQRRVWPGVREERGSAESML